MGMPAAKGLFHKAMAISGSLFSLHTPESANRLATAVLSELGINRDQLDRLHAVPASQLVAAAFAAQQKAMPFAFPRYGATQLGLGWQPVVDGTVLPTRPFEPDAPATSSEIPFLVGSTFHEFSPGTNNPGSERMTWEQLQGRLQRALGSQTAPVIAEYRRIFPGAKPLEIAGVVGATIPTVNEPAMGSSSARVTLMEISDYHCPFCKRQAQQTFPQLVNDYVKTGKVQFVFVDYPIAQLHPRAARAHEAAICAGEQNKYWEMHVSLFNNPVANDDGALIGQANVIGLDPGAFQSCLTSGRHAASIQASVKRIEQLGIAGTPMVVLGYTPAAGQPLKVEKYVYGAQPYSAFKEAIDSLLK